MNTQVKEKVENSDFTNALHEWLSGEVTGHLGTYMYTDDADDHRWKDGHSAETYYLGRDDKATFNLAVNDLGIHVKSFLDLGPGGEASVLAKSVPIVKALGAKNYYPVDLSPTLANEALMTMKTSLESVGGHTIITDFFDTIPGNKERALLAIMGGTIGNFETYTNPKNLQERLSQIFSIYRRTVDENSYFLVSFDANNNGKEIVACYDNPEFGGLVRTCVQRKLDTSGFDYHVAWTPENYQLATGLKANRDQIIRFDGAEYAIEEGEYLPVLNSYRFPVFFITEAAEKAGWSPLKTWSATGRTHYMLFAAI
ncbi:MAG: L-histidine N(alpha)-methyltransferase [Alphaproteobacteria bacterium]|nr:L-histidine N(alpha)-methyltransferase [Alphaproteobacteria bacterium]